MRFISYVYREGVKAGTINTNLAAVNHAQVLLGLGIPKIFSDMPKLDYVIRGIKKCTRQLTHTRLPITLWLMKSLRKHWIANNTKRDLDCSLYVLFWLYEDW